MLCYRLTEKSGSISYLLFLVQCQTGTGDRKLDNEDQQKNNHVLEAVVKDAFSKMLLTEYIIIGLHQVIRNKKKLRINSDQMWKRLNYIKAEDAIYLESTIRKNKNII